MTKYPCIESTINTHVGEYWVRLWINKTAIPEDHRRETEIATQIRGLDRFNKYKIPSLIRRIIEIVPNLNAVEVRDGAVGTVVYVVDFGDKDPHG